MHVFCIILDVNQVIVCVNSAKVIAINAYKNTFVRYFHCLLTIFLDKCVAAFGMLAGC